MLAYPPKATADMMGCSARVAFHKLGMIGSLQHDNAVQIADKINELLTNKIYKENILALREIDKQYSDTFTTFFKKLQPLQ
jgi:hypothetical protein